MLMPEPFSPSLRAGGALGGHTPGGPQVVFEKVGKKNSERRLVLGLILILVVLETMFYQLF